MNYLHNLAVSILSIESNGLPKVRLAKLMYFSHKWLVFHHIQSIQDMKFIRMPLGPVPVGFQDIEFEQSVKVTEVQNGLAYNKLLYTVVIPNIAVDGSIVKYIQSLQTVPTSMLIEWSHKDVSWSSRMNGDEYYIDQADVNNISFPVAQNNAFRLEDQKIQSLLVEGMLDDIVTESTKLEYPNA